MKYIISIIVFVLLAGCGESELSKTDLIKRTHEAQLKQGYYIEMMTIFSGDRKEFGRSRDSAFYFQGQSHAFYYAAFGEPITDQPSHP